MPKDAFCNKLYIFFVSILLNVKQEYSKNSLIIYTLVALLIISMKIRGLMLQEKVESNDPCWTIDESSTSLYIKNKHYKVEDTEIFYIYLFLQ